ncbi:hypothetical protein FB451DRAFT_1278462 [Mycena latifolia]|nr:hypothetical protein FB451DRAFT_1278462 [Mycena latifolia]
MESGWTRVNSSDTIHGFFYRSIRRNDWASRGWLAQGGYIFNILDITSNHDDYILVSEIAYELKLFSGCNSIPQGYLFLCPLADLQSDSLSWFRRPECPAYWALDPSGVEHLSAEEAEQLGFPCLELTMMGFGESWDESVYIGSRQLHQAKGFKPDGQDVAWMLGYPLYEIPPGILNPSAHVEETEDFTEDSEVEFNNESPPETNKEESSPGPSLIQASCSRDQAEIPRLSMARKIAIGVHLTLIILSFFSLFEYYRL